MLFFEKVLLLVFTCILIIGCVPVYPNETVSEAMTDYHIKSNIEAKLKDTKSLAGSNIKIEVNKGTALISGFVKNNRQKEIITKIVIRQPGVIQVKNSTETYSEAHANDSYHKLRRKVRYEKVPY